MNRQSITLTDPNNAWLEKCVESEEFASKSEAVNALIRQARKAEEERAFLIEKLKASEDSVRDHGHIETSPTDRLAGFKAEARKSGRL